MFPALTTPPISASIDKLLLSTFVNLYTIKDISFIMYTLRKSKFVL